MTSRTVLIVEDTELAASTLEIALTAIPGIAVRIAGNGALALDLMHCEVAALLTDLNMPGLDGYQLIERLRGDPRHSRLPIIVISGDTDPATPGKVLALGANAFFLKPFSPALVRAKLEELLQKGAE